VSECGGERVVGTERERGALAGCAPTADSRSLYFKVRRSARVPEGGFRGSSLFPSHSAPFFLSRLFRPEHPTIYRREGKVRERRGVEAGPARGTWIDVWGRATLVYWRQGCSHWGRQLIGMGWLAVRDSSRSVHRASECGSSRTHHD